MLIRQAVILCGGPSSHPGDFAACTPKPLLTIDGQPILEILIRELARFAVDEILLLASHRSDQMEAFARDMPARLDHAITVALSIAPNLAGTGGALYAVRDRLAARFFLLNGDALFDFDLFSVSTQLDAVPEAVAVEVVCTPSQTCTDHHMQLEGTQITDASTQFGPIARGSSGRGVYAVKHNIVADLTPSCSLERDVMPSLAKAGGLRELPVGGFFLAIDGHEDLARAQTILPTRRRRPAVFLDRDGVINLDHGHVGTIEQFEWNAGVPEAIRLLNDRGYYVFVVTNQAGIGKNLYSEADYYMLRRHIRKELAARGARIDDERYCPYHPEAILENYRRVSPWRKPSPGMLLDLMQAWPIEIVGSFLIGDMPTDLAAASAAGIPSYLFEGGRLDTFVMDILAGRTPRSA